MYTPAVFYFATCDRSKRARTISLFYIDTTVVLLNLLHDELLFVDGCEKLNPTHAPRMIFFEYYLLLSL